MEPIRVIICDDTDHVLDCITSLLDGPEFKVVGCAMSTAECLKLLESTDADVLLLDIQMEYETAGIDIIPKIKSDFPKLKIIILTGFEDELYVFNAFANGADNYVLKSLDFDIQSVIKSTYLNQSSLHSDIAQKLARKTQQVANIQQSYLYLINMLTKLSVSEFDVLIAIYQGNKYKTIAKQRFVEECTIKTQAQRILKKTGFPTMKKLIEVLRKDRILEFYMDIIKDSRSQTTK